MHEKGLQRHIGFGTLVSIQERRVLLVPRIHKPRMNRLSTAGFVPPSVYIDFPLLVLRETNPGGHSSIVWRVRGAVFSGANNPCRRPVLPVPARPRRRAVRRPLPSRLGYVRVLDSTGEIWVFIPIFYREDQFENSDRPANRFFDSVNLFHTMHVRKQNFCFSYFPEHNYEHLTSIP